MTNPTDNQSNKTDSQSLPVLIHLELWAEPDTLERVGTVEVDVSDVVAELSPEDREALSDAALANDPSLDWIYYRLIELGLLTPHDGPFTVDLDPLAELLEQNPAALDSVPLRPKRVVTAGTPLVRPVSTEQALADADENGFLTALIQVPFDDLLAAHASRDDQYDEHDLLAAKVSPLLPYASEYRVVGLVHDEDGVSQPDLLVLFTNNVAEAAALAGPLESSTQPSAADRLEELDELSALASMGEYELSESEIAEMDKLRALYLKNRI